MVAANSINESTTGVVGFTGTAFTATPVTDHAVIVGAGTSSTLTNVSPSATSGVALVSQGAAADPAFGTVVVAGGGTGAVTLTGSLVGNGTSAVTAVTGNDGVLISSHTGVISFLAGGTTGQVLTATTNSPPTWAAPATSGTVTSVSGTANQVAVATGTTTPVISLIGPYTPATYTAHGVLIGEGTSSIVATATGSAGQILQSGGASADPSYSTATYPSTSGTSGNVLTSDGTNWTSATPAASGTFVKQTRASTSAKVHITTVAPFGNTIPTATSGDLVVSCSITPANTNNVLVFQGSMTGTINSTGNVIEYFLIQSGVTNALASWVSYTLTTQFFSVPISYFKTAGSTSALTFSIYMGVAGASADVNGAANAAAFGVPFASLIISEYTA